jgi:hypothetical protein
VWRAYQVQKPQVTLTVAGTTLTAEPPADTTAVEFFDRAKSLGVAREKPFAVEAGLQGVQTIYAVATTPQGKTPSRPLTVVNGWPLDWAEGRRAVKVAEVPANVVLVSDAARATARAIAAGQPAQPSDVAALEAELEPLTKSPHVEQREAAGTLIRMLDSPASAP